ncbi:MAG: hypothetical protein OHK006_03520 [Thermodesulfovibrionales bacterium]
MAKKPVVILAKSRELLKTCNSFFVRHRSFVPHIATTADVFRTACEAQKPAAAIIEDRLFDRLSCKTPACPIVIALTGAADTTIPAITGRAGLRYIREPYLVDDIKFQMVTAIEDFERIDALNRRIVELETLNDIMHLLSTTLDPKEVLFRVVRRIADIMPVSRCSVISVDWIRKTAFVVATFEDPNITGLELNLKKYPEIVKALSSKRPVVIRNVHQDPIMTRVREALAPLGIRAILVIPIILRTKVIGTLFLRTSRKERAFDETEIRLLNVIAHASANALHNAFKFEKIEDEKTRLEKLAITDYLTGIYNVRYFLHRIIEEFSRAQRYHAPVSCLMLDIDLFKKINDQFGHKAGDSVLREFAELLRKHSRKSDVLARYGGEEFIVLLPHTAYDGAVAEAERIREFIRSHRFKALGRKVGLTVSVGVAVYPHASIHSHDDLIAAADDALYQAKQSGRDRTVVATR